MSKVTILNIRSLNPECPVQQSFKFEVAMRSVAPLNKPLQWRVVYIGANDNDQFDQVLEQFEVPVQEACEFQFEIDACQPVLTKLPSIEDVFDTTAICIMVFYGNKEFFRCSFLVSHCYPDNQPRDHFTEEGLVRYVYTKEPPRTIVKENFCWDDQIENIRDMIRPEEQEDLNKLSSMTTEMLTSLDNPFQINENSMFHPNNMQKQVQFDTSMPYQGFMANDAGGMQEQRPQHGSFGGGMFGN